MNLDNLSHILSFNIGSSRISFYFHEQLLKEMSFFFLMNIYRPRLNIRIYNKRETDIEMRKIFGGGKKKKMQHRIRSATQVTN